MSADDAWEAFQKEIKPLVKEDKDGVDSTTPDTSMAEAPAKESTSNTTGTKRKLEETRISASKAKAAQPEPRLPRNIISMAAALGGPTVRPSPFKPTAEDFRDAVRIRSDPAGPLPAAAVAPPPAPAAAADAPAPAVASTDEPEVPKPVLPSKPIVREAAGKTWVDPKMAEFPENDFRLFVGNLGPDTTEKQLTDAFSKYKSFVMARVPIEKHSKKSKGYGFVSFMDGLECAKALREMDGKWVGQRPVQLKRSNWKERTVEEKKKAKRFRV